MPCPSVSDIFHVFSPWERGKGSPRRYEGRGPGFLGVSAGNRGGGSKHFFSGPKIPPSEGGENITAAPGVSCYEWVSLPGKVGKF